MRESVGAEVEPKVEFVVSSGGTVDSRVLLWQSLDLEKDGNEEFLVSSCGRLNKSVLRRDIVGFRESKLGSCGGLRRHG